MIIDALFTGLIGFAGIFISVLPNASDFPLPEQWYDGLHFVVSNAMAWNEVFPIDTMLSLITMVIVIDSAVLLFRGVVFAVNFVRGSGA